MQIAVSRSLFLHACEVRVCNAHHAGADRTAPPLASVRRRRDARIADRLLCRAEGETVRAVGELDELAIDAKRRGVEVLDLGRDPRRKAAGVEQADWRGAAFSGQYRAPRCRDVIADRRDEAEAGDRHPALSRRHELAPAANSTRAVATVVPATSALNITRDDAAS